MAICRIRFFTSFKHCVCFIQNQCLQRVEFSLSFEFAQVIVEPSRSGDQDFGITIHEFFQVRRSRCSSKSCMDLDWPPHLRDKLRRLGSDLERQFPSRGEHQYRDLAFRWGRLEKGLQGWQEERSRFARTSLRLNKAVSGKVS